MSGKLALPSPNACVNKSEVVTVFMQLCNHLCVGDLPLVYTLHKSTGEEGGG